MEVARRAGDLIALGEAMNSNFLGRGGFSSTEERLASAEEVLGIAEVTGSLEGRFWGHWQRLGAFLGIGDVAGVDVELAALRPVAEEYRQPFYLYFIPLLDAMRALGDGRWSDAEKLIPQPTSALGAPTSAVMSASSAQIVPSAW